MKVVKVDVNLLVPRFHLTVPLVTILRESDCNGGRPVFDYSGGMTGVAAVIRLVTVRVMTNTLQNLAKSYSKPPSRPQRADVLLFCFLIFWMNLVRNEWRMRLL